MKTFSADDVARLWPHWRPDAFSRFCAEVFRRGPKVEAAYDGTEFLCMAIDRWLAHVCPQFNESQRNMVTRRLRDEDPFPPYGGLQPETESVEGFFLSVFDDRWVTWSNATYFVDLRTYEIPTALPQPHIWVKILGVTPMYFRLLKDLERTDAPCSS